MNETYISIRELHILGNKISWDIGEGELNAIIGSNKSGKTTLAKIICGRIFNYKGTLRKNIDFADISFSDYTADSARFHYSDFYYQQRYNFSDSPDLEPIKNYLEYDDNNVYQASIFTKVLTENILTKKIIELSSGESRKLLLLKSILKSSKIYVLDNPFTGLDSKSVFILTNVFKMMVDDYDKTVILLLNNDNQLATFDKTIYLNTPKEVLKPENQSNKENIFFKTPNAKFNTAFEIYNQTIKVGGKTLITDLSWSIHKGEKWLLKGDNGSGKSTLMSLINADNPSAYSLDIKLFDRKRGTGESIWAIKSKIGFVSPEIQLFWDGTHSVKNIIFSGFSNTMVLNRKINEAEKQNYLMLLHLFQLETIENCSFGTISSGEKRMVMVLRALINNPPLLIVDEPFQGLDSNYFNFLYEFLSHCMDKGRTVIQIAHRENEILPCINHVAQIKNQRFNILT